MGDEIARVDDFDMGDEIARVDDFKPTSSFSFNLFTKRSWLQTSSKSTILGSKMSGFRWYTVCKINWKKMKMLV